MFGCCSYKKAYEDTKLAEFKDPYYKKDRLNESRLSIKRYDTRVYVCVYARMRERSSVTNEKASAIESKRTRM